MPGRVCATMTAADDQDPVNPRRLPGPPEPAPDRDHRASLRTLLAAELLRRGEDLAHVAEVTGVPVALVELIRTEQVLEVPAPNTSRDRSGWKVQQQRLVKNRMLVFVAVVIDVAAVANLVVGITALYQRSAALSVADRDHRLDRCPHRLRRTPRRVPTLRGSRHSEPPPGKE